MGAILQSLKILFLVFTTGITIYMFLRDARKGLYIYLVFMCLSGFLGFARPIYAEAIVLPLCIILGRGSNSRNVVHSRWIFLLLITCFTTFIFGNDIENGFDQLFFMGFIMFAFSRKLFPDNKHSVNILMLLWCYAFCRVLWLMRVGGAGVMAISDISDDSTRMIVAETGLQDDAVVDPNYFGYVTGLGAVLSFMYYRFRNEFNAILGFKFLRKKYLPAAILVIGCVEIFLTIRGLSRGMLLAVLAATITYFFLQKKLWHIIITGLFFCVVLFFISHTQIFELYIERFETDDEGAGRFIIWSFIWSLMHSQGFLFMLLGGGLSYPWWEHFSITAGESYFSTHNSWMTVLLNCGILGLGIFVVTIFQSVMAGLHSLNAINQTKIVLLAYIIVGSCSIEPLGFSWGWIPLVVACSIWKNNSALKSLNNG